MSAADKSEGRGTKSRKSIARRITAQQIGEQISLLIFFDLLVLTTLAVVVVLKLGETSLALSARGAISSEAAVMGGAPNILYDSYTIARGVERSAGVGLYNPFAPLLGLPEGTVASLQFRQISEFNFAGNWAEATSAISLPIGDGRFNRVQFIHNALFNDFLRCLATLLIIELIVIIRAIFKVGRRTRKTLRPITDLTLAAQSMNFQQNKLSAPIATAANAASAAPMATTASAASTANAAPTATTAFTVNTASAAPASRYSADPETAESRPAFTESHPNFTASSEPALKLTGAINTLNMITERHLDRRIAIDDERVELKGLASAINGMLDRLDAAYHAQLRFVSDASHELRTPISVIQGYANLLDRWGKNDEKTLQESIDAIKNEADSMKELVEQLLFLARGDNRSITFIMEEVDVSALVEEVAREMMMIDENHGYVVKTDGGLYTRADYQLLKQLLRILTDNSVKYTPDGGRITLGASRSASRAGYVEMSVSDSGIGIPEEALPHIFERFYRADESRARSSGGTGLGLSIAKWIADNHDGVVEVVSRKDVGTKFTLSFPETVAAKPAEATVSVKTAASAASTKPSVSTGSADQSPASSPASPVASPVFSESPVSQASDGSAT